MTAERTGTLAPKVHGLCLQRIQTNNAPIHETSQFEASLETALILSRIILFNIPYIFLGHLTGGNYVLSELVDQ